MAQKTELMKTLDHISEEIAALKKAISRWELKNSDQSKKAWNDLVAASKEVAARWDKVSAVEEIRDQREKKW